MSQYVRPLGTAVEYGLRRARTSPPHGPRFTQLGACCNPCAAQSLGMAPAQAALLGGGQLAPVIAPGGAPSSSGGGGLGRLPLYIGLGGAAALGLFFLLRRRR